MKDTNRVFSSQIEDIREIRLSQLLCVELLDLFVNGFITVVTLEGDEEDGSTIEDVTGDVSGSLLFNIEFEPS